MSIISDDLRARQTQLIDAWLTDMRVRGRADSTIDTYAEITRRAHAELLYGLAGSTNDELKAWIWRPGRAPATRKLYRAALVSFCRWSVAQGYVDFDAASGLPTVSVPEGPVRLAPQDVLADILARAAQPYRLWVLLAAGMGLRCVEVSRLDREHVTAEQTWVQGKGAKNAYMPTHPAVWAAVAGLPDGPVARKRDGSRASRIDVRVRANAHIARLGHKGVTMHQFRRWYGDSIFRAAARDPMIAKAALRHSDVKVTQRYLRTDNLEVTAAQLAIPLPI